MAIIISKNGKNAKKIEKLAITKEGYLQKYIYDNPEAFLSMISKRMFGY